MRSLQRPAAAGGFICTRWVSPLALLTATSSAPPPHDQRPPGLIDWHTRLDKARAAAHETNKLRNAAEPRGARSEARSFRRAAPPEGDDHIRTPRGGTSIPTPARR